MWLVTGGTYEFYIHMGSILSMLQSMHSPVQSQGHVVDRLACKEFK